jgi:hypothetical protein
MATQKNGRGYSSRQLEEFAKTVQRLLNETAGMRILLGELAQRLTNPRARTFALQGIGRRLPMIARGARNIFKLYPPDTAELLSLETCDEVAIQFQAFAINMYGLMDNIAWVCVLESGGALNPLKINLFKREVLPYLPDELKDYVGEPTSLKWFNEYGKAYRDSTAHRIPPYLPSRAYTNEEGQIYQDLDRRASVALIEAGRAHTDIARAMSLVEQYEDLVQEKESLGSNSLLVALSLNGEDAAAPVYLHPQVLSDWGLAVELLQVFDRSLRDKFGWPTLAMPDLIVR